MASADPRTFDRSSRARLAEQAWQRLPAQQATLQIACPASHHLAAVFETPIGPVYRSQIRRHAHGARDLPDTPHRGLPAKSWFDLLDLQELDPQQADDQLPAWCECGPRMLSRAAVLEWMTDHEHRVVVG